MWINYTTIAFPFQIHISLLVLFLFSIPLPGASQITQTTTRPLINTTSLTATLTTTTIPKTTTNNPATITNNPATITNNPAIITNNPAATVNNPATPTNNPATPTNNPATPTNNPATPTNNPATPTTMTTSAIAFPKSNSSSNSTAVFGCGADLEPIYKFLCDRQAAWGIVAESLATLGFLVSAGLLVGLLFWTLWVCVSPRRRREAIGGTVASMSMFLIGTAGVFALTFAFIIRLTPQTCPTRLFLFGVLFSLAFSCLLARCLALLGFAMARGWGEAAVALALFIVQVVIAVEWQIIVLVRDGKPCQYTQGEFVMLLIYVLCLLAGGLVLSLRSLCRSCLTYSYNYTGGTHRQSQAQATLLCLTLLLSACIWVVWIALLTRGNPEMGRRPLWDDPVLSIALVANGWVLLLGHGLPQVAYLCKGACRAKEGPLSFAGWTSPNAEVPGMASLKEGRENGSFENDGEDKKGRRKDPAVRSPYESGFSMTEIDPDKDYTIPRPQTTNISEPYDEYYGHNLSE